MARQTKKKLESMRDGMAATSHRPAPVAWKLGKFPPEAYSAFPESASYARGRKRLDPM